MECREALLSSRCKRIKGGGRGSQMLQVVISADLEEGGDSIGKTLKLLWATVMAAFSDSTKNGGLPKSVGQAERGLLSPSQDA